jgi:hypothetical protein
MEVVTTQIPTLLSSTGEISIDKVDEEAGIRIKRFRALCPTT